MGKTLTEDLNKIFAKHKCKGFAYAVVKGHDDAIIAPESEVGYGASYPVGTEDGLIRKLKIIIEDIKGR